VHQECLFCRIASGEVPAHVVCRDDTLVAFLDVGPIRPGHVQIIPLAHFETFDDLPAELASAILHLGQRLAKVLKEVYGVDRVGFMFTGGDISHAHAHLVPLVEKTDITSRRYIVESGLTYRALPNPGSEVLRDIAAMLARRLSD
jgi:histidine triad (HIT) family protein